MTSDAPQPGGGNGPGTTEVMSIVGGLDYAVLFNAVANAMAFTERSSGRILDVNAAWIRSTGIGREQSAGRTALELGVWADPAQRQACLAEFEKTGRVVDFEAGLRMKSAELPHLISARSVDIGGRQYVLWEFRDITEQKRLNEALIQGQEKVRSLLAESEQSRRALLGILEDERRTREALRQSESRIKSISDNLTAGMIYQVVIHPDGRRQFTYLSDSVRTLYGISPEEGMADAAKIYGRIHEDDIRSLIEAENEAVKTCSAFKAEFRIHDPSGEVRWSSFASIPKRMEDGSTCWDGIEYIITDRKRAEEALRDSEERYHSLFEAAGDAILVMEDDRFIDCNPKSLDLFGCTREQILQMTPFRFSPARQPDGQTSEEKGSEKITAALAGRPQFFEWRHCRLDGAEFEAEVTLTRLTIAGKPHLLAFIRDITERKRAEVAQARLLHILESSLNEIYVFDAETLLFEYVNRGAQRNLGYTLDALHRMTLLQVQPEFTEDSFRRMVAPLRRHELEKQVFVTFHRRAAGSLYPVEAHLQLVELAGQRLFLAVILDITDRKLAEEALHESELLLQESQTIAGLGNYVLDIRTGEWKSSAMLDIVFGIDPAYPRTVEGWEALIHPEDRRQMGDYFANEVVGKGIRFDREYRILRQNDQAVRWVHGLGYLEFNAQRRPLRMHGTIQDITDRKKAEATLKESEERYRISALMTGQLVYDYDCLTGTIKWAGSIPSITGYSSEEFQGVDIDAWSDMIHPEDRPAITQMLDEAMAAGKVFMSEYRFRRNDGSFIWVEDAGSFLLNNEGKAYRMLGTMKDISGRKQAEKTLQESEQRFRCIVEASPMGMHLYELRDDGELILIDANPAADRYTGIRTADRIGMTIEQAFPGLAGTEIPARYKEVAAGGQAWQTTNLFYQDNSIRGAFDIVAFQTVPGRMATMFLEVSDRIHAEQQREQLVKALQTKTEELESIIYVSYHDLRSPLVNIQGFSGELQESCRQIRNLLAGDADPQSRQQRLDELVSREIPSALDFITTSVRKLDTLQKGLLKISRIGRDSLEIVPVAMNRLIDGAIKSTQYQLDNCGARVTVEPLPDCRADPALLAQVFTNLIDNAIKYRSPDRSLVVRIYGRVEGARCVYAVADNGIGIAPEHQKKVFELFHQLNPINGPGGEGLGLTIVKRVLGRMDGEVRLESAPGVGSVFFVLLPRNAEK
jgi:PAS domain S-box-containing protein